ncbi:MAG: hypothetical protein KDC38_09855 [Planctomycetes bacterium]|nr:hypothetical protein [Planctomycetota bacterium]
MAPTKSSLAPELLELGRRLWPDVDKPSEIHRRFRVCEALRVLSAVDGVDWLVPPDGSPRESILAELGYFADRDLATLARALCRWQPTVRDALRWLRAFRNGLPRADEAVLVERLVSIVREYSQWHEGVDDDFVARVLRTLSDELQSSAE